MSLLQNILLIIMVVSTWILFWNLCDRVKDMQKEQAWQSEVLKHLLTKLK